MATAHLYETEDVAATLLHAYKTGDSKRAIAAAAELYVSQESELLLNLLLFAWLLRPPERTTAYCVAAITERNPKALALCLADDLSYDYPPLLPDLPQPTPPPPRTDRDCAWTHPQLTLEQASTVFHAIRNALRQRHWQHAVFLATPYIHDAVAMTHLFTCLKFPQPFIDLLERNVYDPLTHRIVMHVFAAVCHPPFIKSKYAVFGTSNSIGARSGRVFTVPPEARGLWHIHPKPPARLQHLPLHILDDTATNVWQTAVKTYEIRAVDQMFVAPDDTAIEEFYVNCFPDDIPDEWSNEERAKSHTTTVVPNQMNPWIPAFHMCWS